MTSLRHDFEKLSRKLAGKRFEYMHNESFLFEFIKELNLPTIVLDHHQQIYTANNKIESILKSSQNAVLGNNSTSLGLTFKRNY